MTQVLIYAICWMVKAAFNIISLAEGADMVGVRFPAQGNEMGGNRFTVYRLHVGHDSATFTSLL